MRTGSEGAEHDPDPLVAPECVADAGQPIRSRLAVVAGDRDQTAPSGADADVQPVGSSSRLASQIAKGRVDGASGDRVLGVRADALIDHHDLEVADRPRLRERLRARGLRGRV
jgi:hypothetical protein